MSQPCRDEQPTLGTTGISTWNGNPFTKFWYDEQLGEILYEI